MIWKLEQLQRNDTEVCINGRWVPARPINWKHRSLRQRLKEAWAVFVGKAEAFVWPEDEEG